jgi:hypothetical protein
MVATVMIVLTCPHLLRKIDKAIRLNITVFDSQRFDYPSRRGVGNQKAFAEV